MSNLSIDDQEIETVEEVELDLTEDQNLSGDETDLSLEADGSIPADAEVETQPDAEEFEEVDFESVDFGSFSEAQSENKQDEDVKKHNSHNAKQRVLLKQKEEELTRLKDASASGFIESDPKPKRTDFLSEDTLYDNYNGNVDLARASDEEEQHNWQE